MSGPSVPHPLLNPARRDLRGAPLRATPLRSMLMGRQPAASPFAALGSVPHPLDDAATFAADRSGMLGHVAALGRDLERTWRETAAPALTPPEGGWRAVVIAGVGGSATGGDYLAGLVTPTSAIPVQVTRGMSLPAFIDPRTIVICCSHSGNTEETLTCYDQARASGARVLAVRSGGELDRRARRDAVPGALIRDHIPPRAALGHALGALLRLGESIGIASGATVPAAARGHDELVRGRLGPSVPLALNPAKRLATALAGRVVIVVAADHLAAAAERFKNQLSENGKAFAAAMTLPEAAHNTVVGLETADRHGDHLALVTLESETGYAPRLAERFRLVADMFAARGIPAYRVRVQGESRLADQVEATAWADLVSCYVALINGQDPTPIPPILHIRAALQYDAAHGEITPGLVPGG